MRRLYFFMTDAGASRRLDEIHLELPALLIIIGAVLAGESDRRPQLLQHFKVFIQASLRNSHLSGKLRWRTGSFLADKLIEA
jgi:hypothetical protein